MPSSPLHRLRAKAAWLSLLRVSADLYPVTIVQTRYGGIYEGGAWAAFLSHPEEIPPDAFGGDSVCVSWWSDFVYAVGVGATPDSALADLKAKHAAGHRLPAHASD